MTFTVLTTEKLKEAFTIAINSYVAPENISTLSEPRKSQVVFLNKFWEEISNRIKTAGDKITPEMDNHLAQAIYGGIMLIAELSKSKGIAVSQTLHENLSTLLQEPGTGEKPSQAQRISFIMAFNELLNQLVFIKGDSRNNLNPTNPFMGTGTITQEMLVSFMSDSNKMETEERKKYLLSFPKDSSTVPQATDFILQRKIPETPLSNLGGWKHIREIPTNVLTVEARHVSEPGLLGIKFYSPNILQWPDVNRTKQVLFLLTLPRMLEQEYAHVPETAKSALVVGACILVNGLIDKVNSNSFTRSTISQLISQNAISMQDQEVYLSALYDFLRFVMIASPESSPQVRAENPFLTYSAKNHSAKKEHILDIISEVMPQILNMVEECRSEVLKPYKVVSSWFGSSAASKPSVAFEEEKAPSLAM